MITVKIDTSERQNDAIDARWITQQVNSRRQNGEPFCIRFKINCGDNNLNLTAGDCPAGSGRGIKRQFTKMEDHLIDEWRRRGFVEKGIKPGMVVSFWELVKKTCG